MVNPFVSCLMPTYNRFPFDADLVNEAVESYNRQTYPSAYRELIIWNDCPGQVLSIDAFHYSNVRIVNTSRFASLGEKRNALVAVSHGAILLPWDDDDISLPNRIQQAVDKLTETVEQQYYKGHSSLPLYWNPRHYWYLPSGSPYQTLLVPSSLGYAHNCSAMTRIGFYLSGGYPATSGDEDQKMDRRLRFIWKYGESDDRVVDGLGNLHPEEWSYIYRWGVSPHHLSGKADLVNHYKEIGERAVKHGVFEINPKWNRPYDVLARDAAQKLKTSRILSEERV